jgi:hypothetical protein
MPPTAWRRALRHRVTVMRAVTSVSDTGDSTTSWDTVVSAGVPCSLQDAGGRQRHDAQGLVPARQKRVIFGPEAQNIVQQNDLLIVESVDPAETYKVLHLHLASDGNGAHIKGMVEQWMSAGQV